MLELSYNEIGVFYKIPFDILSIVLSYLDVKGLCRIAQLNTSFRKLSEQEHLWREIGRRLYSSISNFPTSPSKEDVKTQWTKPAWKPYSDLLVDSDSLTAAAIIGLDGNIWASTKLDLRKDEASQIISGFDNSSIIKSRGVYAQQNRYMITRADESSFYGLRGAGGIVCYKTNLSVLVGIYGAQHQPGFAANVVEKLADYLISLGY